MSTHLVRIPVLLAALCAPALHGQAPPPLDVAELRIHPARVTLDSAQDRHAFVVVATDRQGVTHDVTAAAELTMTADGIAAVDGEHSLRGLRDGEVELVARFGGARASSVVAVRDAARMPEISFRNDVLPVLTRQGCNAGACHGSAAGKNGFHLSLFGYDPAADHRALTRELHGRRVDPAEPAMSLMLAKPTRQVQHKGGLRFEVDSAPYRTLCGWIGAGAVDDGEGAARLEGLAIEPPELVLEGPGASMRLCVTARYADGSLRDVTDLALVSSSSETTAALGAGSVVTSGEPGEAFVMARFGSLAEVAQVIVLPAPDPEAAAWAWPDVPEQGEIDAEIHAKLKKLRLLPAEVCDDFTFVRRVHLDVLGRLPSPGEVLDFVADARDDKRQLLVDELLARPEFADVWAAQWAEVLRVESRVLRDKGMHLYTRWLREAFQDGVPFDRLVRELLTSQGSNFDNPASSFYVVERDPKVLAENVAQTFMGIRVQCAQCHDHPFERWTMDDYYGFVAFFAQVSSKAGEDPRERVVHDRRGGEVRNPRSGAVAKPRFLGGVEPEIARGTDRRLALAEWLTAEDNPYFAANVANRVWARFFGRGLVEPVDDLRVSNPASHPRLHRLLGRVLAESRFDLRALIRLICASRTYQLAAHPARSPAAAFAGAQIRRLTAEQLLDAIGQVTGVPTKFRGLPPGASAMQVPGGDPQNRFLDLFGRPRRASVCACERRAEPTLNQVLHLVNGETIERKIQSPDGRLARQLEAGAAPESMVDELFLAAYGRPPRPDEAARVLVDVRSAEDPRAAWQDVYWAVLNSKEFVFQH